MRLLGILNQIRILLEEQNDLLREIHLATRGTPALTNKRRPVDPASPFRKRTGSDVWQRTPETADVRADRERQSRESAVASAVASDALTTPSTDGSEPRLEHGQRPTDEQPSGPLESRRG